MDEVVIKLEDGRYLAMWFSDNPAATEGCDSCIGYILYDGYGVNLDGGEMDYNEYTAGYNSIFDAIPDVIEFATEELLEYEMTGLSIDDFE
jgi:hypothetical protein